VPGLPGLDEFEGPWCHTARWPKEGVDFAGQRVGLVGTGSTGIQIAPEIAAVAEHLYVFQRTANLAVPNRNRPWLEAEERAFKSGYREYRQETRESFLGVPVTGTGRPCLTSQPRTCSAPPTWAGAARTGVNATPWPPPDIRDLP
jgi:cation diffusion facilitator CzcD-associated flavoprotein CzcO